MIRSASGIASTEIAIVENVLAAAAVAGADATALTTLVQVEFPTEFTARTR